MPLHVTEIYNVSPRLIEELMIDEGIDYSKMCAVMKRLKEVIERDELRQVIKQDIKTIPNKNRGCRLTNGTNGPSGFTSGNGRISKGGS